MGRLRAKSDYEDLRNARILENKARLASLGLHKTLSDLRSISSSAKSQNSPVRKNEKKPYGLLATHVRRSLRLKGVTSDSTPRKAESIDDVEDDYYESRSARSQLSPEESSRRCSSKARGTVYNSVYGICCHFCRQKTLCVEEDCKRCGTLDLDQPCIGKTDCSVCHSSNGVLCRACLMVRYGEELEEVKNDKNWMCPHCIEEKGTKPYWICNSSFCLKKRKMVPTGLAIYRARELGYKSVAHLLMDELQRGKKH